MNLSKKRLAMVCSLCLFTALLFIGAGKYSIPTKTESIMPWTYGHSDHTNGLYWVSVYNSLEVGFNLSDEDVYRGLWPAPDGDDYLYHGGLWFGIKIGDTIYVIEHYHQGNDMEWIPKPPCEFFCLQSDDPNWSQRPPYVEQIGEFDTWTICNDWAATEAGPVGLDAERHTFSWSIPNHNDYVVHQFLVRNLSGDDLNNFYLGFPYDFDVGGGWDYLDDLLGYEGNDTTDEWTNPTNPGEHWTVQTPDGIPDEYDAVNFDPPQSRSLAYMYDSDETPSGYVGIRVFGYYGDYPGGEFILASSSHSEGMMVNDDSARYALLEDTGYFEEIHDAPDDWRLVLSIGPIAELADGEEFSVYLVEGCSQDILEMRRNFDQVVDDWLGADGIPGTGDDWEDIYVGISLLNFTTSSAAEGVLLNWDVDSPEDGVFNIYRAPAASQLSNEEQKYYSASDYRKTGWTKVNSRPISGAPPYSYVDTDAGPGCDYTYYLEFVPKDDGAEIVGESSICFAPSQTYSLSQSYPNPSDGILTIDFSLAKPSSADINLYDISGRLIAVLLSADLTAGEHSLTVDLNQLGISEGIYIYQIATEDYFASRKLVFSK
jgi:hypothetical protein